MKSFSRFAAVLAALMLACAFIACSNDSSSSTTTATPSLAAFVQADASSSYDHRAPIYKFCANNVFEMIDFEGNSGSNFSTSTGTYTGDATSNGSVDITIEGTTFTFTITGNNATETASSNTFHKIIAAFRYDAPNGGVDSWVRCYPDNTVQAYIVSDVTFELRGTYTGDPTTDGNVTVTITAVSNNAKNSLVGQTMTYPITNSGNTLTYTDDQGTKVFTKQ
ncbi:MAG: hypothetical protein K6G00_00060 [Treponema sp.]|nr:hypothetical protein [Treponema sp.]